MPKIHDVEYRPVVGHPGYRVGRDGSLWSWRTSGGRLTKGGKKKWVLLSPHKNELGYPIACLRGHKTKYVHNLVLEAFFGPRPEGMVACHFPDKNPSNVNLSNLRWGTRSDNERDKTVHGTDNSGEGNGRAKITKEQVKEIRIIYAQGKTSQQKIADRFGLTQAVVSKIVLRHTWQTVD